MVSTWAWAMTCAAAQTMRIKASGIEGLIFDMFPFSLVNRYQFWRRTRLGRGSREPSLFFP
jgi:hypothetical protein